MTAHIDFFPVGSGDMTLITLATGKTILIDTNIRQDADKEDKEDYPDVARMLRDKLGRDDEDRPYVDVFVLSHPDQDHCSGLRRHFHLGAPSRWKKPEEGENEAIIIREMWSSPLTFRRVQEIEGNLCEDAKAWREEAKRRVRLHKGRADSASDKGNLIRVIGQDKNDPKTNEPKTKGIEHLVVKVGDSLVKIGDEADRSFSARLLSPKFVTEEEAEKLSGKNNSSIVMQFSLSSSDDPKEDVADNPDGRFLTGGDAEVQIWGRIWDRNKDSPDNLGYDILQTPHHCSLGALSEDSYNGREGKEAKGEGCKIDDDAYLALSQAEEGAFFIASSDKPEEKTGKDLAKRCYQDIAKNVEGSMLFTSVDSPQKPLRITISEDGPRRSGSKGPVQGPKKKVEKGATEKTYA